MYRARAARVSVATAAAALLAVTLAITVGFSGQVAAITTSQGWADSYTVDGKCYCSSTFDHGVGEFEYQGESVREICRKLGDGPRAGRVYYNTIQCGHEPAHRDSITIDGQRVQDEVVCPGRVGNGVPCNSEKGAKWDLGSIADPPAPPTTKPPTTVSPPQTTPPTGGECTATGANLAQAKTNYQRNCPNQKRQDCDPLPSGGYLCSSANIPSNPPPTPAPTTTPAPPTTTPVPPTTTAPAPSTTAPPTTTAPTTAPTPTGNPDPDDLVLDIYDAGSDVRIDSIWGTGFSLSASDLPNTVAFDLITVPTNSRSVIFSFSGPISSRQIENYAPYASFGNSGSNYLGRNLPEGDYEVSIEIYSGRSGSGNKLADETLLFTVTG